MRRLANAIQVDLSDVAAGWDGCYASVTPASYAECIALSQSSKNSDEAQTINAGIDLIKKHLLGGKVKLLDDDGKLVDGDIEAEDIENSRAITDKLLKAITGVAPDPKGSSTITEASSIPTPTSDTSSSSQLSSTEPTAA